MARGEGSCTPHDLGRGLIDTLIARGGIDRLRLAEAGFAATPCAEPAAQGWVG
jgi:hypothetical protein